MAKRSAGVLLWRRSAEGVEVFLAHPGGPYFAKKDDGVWSAPKGEPDEGEQLWAAAVREFAEETGKPLPPGDPVDLGEARQSGGKLVTLFAVEGDLDPDGCVSNDFEMRWPPQVGPLRTFPEMDRYGWFALDAARVKVFSSQVVFLDRLAALLDGTLGDR